MDGQWALDAYADAGMRLLHGLGVMVLFLIGARMARWWRER